MMNELHYRLLGFTPRRSFLLHSVNPTLDCITGCGNMTRPPLTAGPSHHDRQPTQAAYGGNQRHADAEIQHCVTVLQYSTALPSIHVCILAFEYILSLIHI